jgi:hypothetical protein
MNSLVMIYQIRKRLKVIVNSVTKHQNTTHVK